MKEGSKSESKSSKLSKIYPNYDKDLNATRPLFIYFHHKVELNFIAVQKLIFSEQGSKNHLICVSNRYYGPMANC